MSGNLKRPNRTRTQDAQRVRRSSSQFDAFKRQKPDIFDLHYRLVAAEASNSDTLTRLEAAEAALKKAGLL